MALEMTNAPVPLGEYVPTADHRLVLSGLTWDGFQTLLALRGENAGPRMAYLDGVVELMGASRGHEGTKGNIGCFVEAFCTERKIPWTTLGNWLLDDKSEEAAVEPDDCYVFGPDPDSIERPQLAIEIVWTSGGIKKLEIYRRLRVAEVWFWTVKGIKVYVLVGDQYEQRERSACLPEIDIRVIEELATTKPTSEAVLQYLARLRSDAAD